MGKYVPDLVILLMLGAGSLGYWNAYRDGNEFVHGERAVGAFIMGVALLFLVVRLVGHSLGAWDDNDKRSADEEEQERWKRERW